MITHLRCYLEAIHKHYPTVASLLINQKARYDDVPSLDVGGTVRDYKTSTDLVKFVTVLKTWWNYSYIYTESK